MKTTPHPRGSVMVLVVAVLVIMVIMGVSMMQVARVDRRATAAPLSYINDVAEAVKAYIGDVLRDDLLDESGNFFNPDTTAAGGGDEPYDYPYTLQAAAGWAVYDPVNVATLLGTAFGGKNDDTWLASTTMAQQMSGGAANTWPHITNLMGYYLNWNSTANAGAGAFVLAGTDPAVIVTNNAATTSNFLVPANPVVTNTPLVDADGDGIPDSRWTWATIREVDGRKYFMAIRIIDNSSMFNADVATAMRNSGGTVPAAADEAPRFASPSEIDLMGMVLALGGSSAEVTSLITARIGSPLAPITWNGTTVGLQRDPLVDALERATFWLYGPSLWANFDPAYVSLRSEDAEYHLRVKNGLNWNAAPDNALETALVNFTRSNVDESLLSYNTAGFATYDNYFATNGRLRLTTMSGSMPTFVPKDTELVTATPMRIDVNNEDVDTLYTGIASLITATAINLPAGAATPDDYARRLAASIKDYADADSVLTLSGNHFGFERLPLLTEAYAFRPYINTLIPDTGGDGLDEEQWDQTGPAEYAIEVRNPYPVALTAAELANIELLLDGVSLGTLDTLIGGPLAANAAVVIHNGATISALIGGGATAILTATPFPTTAPSAPVTIELRAATLDPLGPTTGQVVYSRTLLNSLPDQRILTSDAGETTGALNAAAGLWEQNTRGNGSGLDHLTYQVTTAHQEQELFTGTPLTPQLGVEPKTGAVVSTAINTSQLWLRNGLIASAGEVMMVTMLGPTTTQTIGEVWENGGTPAASLDDLRVDVADVAVASALFPNLNVPLWRLLAERFTTLSPVVDLVDNDGNGVVDNVDEQLVTGTINLNTMPAGWIDQALPFPAPAGVGVGAAIHTLRDAPGRGANIKGLAYLTELWDFAGFGSDAADNATWGGIPVDFGDGPDELTPTPDAVADDREEQALFTRWMEQVASVRSDIFTAYILIYGYDDLASPSPAESARYVVVYDRSNVTGSSIVVRRLVDQQVP